MTTPPSAVDAHTGPYIPKTTRDLLATVPVEQHHPGLQLDKFSAGGSQKDHQGQAVQDACKAAGDHEALAWAIQRRAPLLAGATTVTARTEGPFTLHLSRASALENAGICLHPLYGFAYLPGSGLKGMARAWAETNGVSQEEIHAVFGWVPDGKQVKDGCIGAVVFHDAWPTAWPTLIPDIVNNHHPQYYQGTEPPGDWMDPIPVQFLAVAPGTPFLFAVGPRSEGTDPALVTKAVARAVEWLTHALALRGAGAKTNAGYGTFVPVDGPRPAPDPELSFTVTLELTSPAFLAGARQYKDGASEDCDLRPATLRGLLRWWWRTLHAGQMNVADLKAREALIWGDTTRGGAVRVMVRREERSHAVPYNKKSVRERESLPVPARVYPDRDDAKKLLHTQGLFYASYGMDEETSEKDAAGRKIVKRRHVIEPSAKWTVTFQVRNTGLPESAGLTLRGVLDEAKAALWLLCRCGGVGSRSRKGFGCFADLNIKDLEHIATRLRAAPRAGAPAPTPALEDAMFHEWPVSGNAWQILDEAWQAIEGLASGKKHRPEKLALGLPRQIHGPRPQPLPHQLSSGHQPPHRPPLALSGSRGQRHAAPYHLHFGRAETGEAVLRFTGFPSPNLPNATESRAMLAAVRNELDLAFGGQSRRRFPARGILDGDEEIIVIEDLGEKYLIEYTYGGRDEVEKEAVELLN